MHGNRLPSKDGQQQAASTLPPLGSNPYSRSSRSGGWRASGLAIILAAGFAVPAEAQIFWPTEPADEFTEPQRRIQHRRPRIVKKRIPHLPDAPKTAAKPVGPIIIAISIDQQHLKLYDSNGLFAETPVSTGMRGHSTPMGVFSVIQKNKWHRSNIYSGAPMPYMQRLTWSGIAMHAGALPGYPASHGCIRMPNNFAMRLWGWTRMGARVIVAPGELSPTDFSHPLLIARKPESKPLAASPAAASDLQKHVETTPKSDRSTILDAAFLDNAQLRLTPFHDKPLRTADARGAMAQASDAGPGGPAQSAESPKNDAAGDAAANSDAAAGAGEKSGDRTADAPVTGKDQARATDTAAALPVPAPLEGTADFIGPVKPRTGHVAAFVSARDNKLYVRQNFEPWFEVPVTIAASDRPLGTHVFTARTDKDEAGALRWQVVSLPAPLRGAHADPDTPRRKRGKIAADSAAPAPASSAAEALDRLTIPDDAMARIASVVAPGASLVVSDHGLGNETGRGTDFIVPLR